MRQVFKTLRLLLPVLIPSWRFFSAIAPSPRVEFVTLAKEDARTGVTDAQKMVNEASCKLIASAEAVGAATAPVDEDG